MKTGVPSSNDCILGRMLLEFFDYRAPSCTKERFRRLFYETFSNFFSIVFCPAVHRLENRRILHHIWVHSGDGLTDANTTHYSGCTEQHGREKSILFSGHAIFGTYDTVPRSEAAEQRPQWSEVSMFECFRHFSKQECSLDFIAWISQPEKNKLLYAHFHCIVDDCKCISFIFSTLNNALIDTLCNRSRPCFSSKKSIDKKKSCDNFSGQVSSLLFIAALCSKTFLCYRLARLAMFFFSHLVIQYDFSTRFEKSSRRGSGRDKTIYGLGRALVFTILLYSVKRCGNISKKRAAWRSRALSIMVSLCSAMKTVLLVCFQILLLSTADRLLTKVCSDVTSAWF